MTELSKEQSDQSALKGFLANWAKVMETNIYSSCHTLHCLQLSIPHPIISSSSYRS